MLSSGNLNNPKVVMALNQDSHSVSVVDTTTYEVLKEIKVGTHPHEIDVTPDQKYALVSLPGDLYGWKPGDSVALIDTETMEVIRPIEIEKKACPHGVKFLSNDLALVTAAGVKSIFIVNIHTSDKDKIFIGESNIHMVTADIPKNLAYAIAKNGTLIKVDLNDKSITKKKVGIAAESLEISKDGSKILVVNPAANCITVVRANDLVVLDNIYVAYLPLRVAFFNKEKSFAVTCGLSGVVQTYNFDTKKLDTIKISLPVISGSAYFLSKTVPSPACLVVGEDDQSAHVSLYRAGMIAHIDLVNNKINRTANTAYSPDGVALVHRRLV